jgi:DNA-binding MarR family transcriptional regulator
MSPESKASASSARLRGELLDELMSHSPTSVMRVLRQRPGGGISLVHLQVLSVLEHDGSQPMTALAEALDVSSASATGIVDRMEDRGLVVRVREDEDRRIVRVELTDDGRRVLGGLTAERREALRELLDELDDAEAAGLLIGARALRRARERRQAGAGEGCRPRSGGSQRTPAGGSGT